MTKITQFPSRAVPYSNASQRGGKPGPDGNAIDETIDFVIAVEKGVVRKATSLLRKGSGGGYGGMLTAVIRQSEARIKRCSGMLEEAEAPQEPIAAKGLDQLLDAIPTEDFTGFASGLIHLKRSLKEALNKVRCLDAKSSHQICRNWVSEELLHLSSESTKLVSSICENAEDSELEMVG